MTDPADDARVAPFVAHRSLLFTVAYEMLGAAGDAEDVVQEAWLRWSGVDPATVRDPRAYLVQVTTRLALNRCRTLARRKESYAGPWLPEPVATSPDVADDVALAESVSTAMLLVLETLGPVERAVFVLREVFALEYAEIAAAVERTPDAVRQIAHRARSHVTARRPRTCPSAREQEAVVDRFRRATATGDLQALMDVLAPDVVLLTDGGGVRKAARRPIRGRDKVVRFLAAVAVPGTVGEATVVNGAPALRLSVAGELDSVATFVLEDGRVTELQIVRNPDKLGAVDHPATLTRTAAPGPGAPGPPLPAPG